MVRYVVTHHTAANSDMVFAVSSEGGAVSMRGLFAVWIVDPAEGIVVHRSEIVAEDESRAKLKVLLQFPKVSREKAFDIDAYDVLVQRIGAIRGR